MCFLRAPFVLSLGCGYFADVPYERFLATGIPSSRTLSRWRTHLELTFALFGLRVIIKFQELIFLPVPLTKTPLLLWKVAVFITILLSRANNKRLPQNLFPFLLFLPFWGSLCFRLTRQKHVFFCWGPNSSLGETPISANLWEVYWPWAFGKGYSSCLSVCVCKCANADILGPRWDLDYSNADVKSHPGSET